MGPVLYLYAVFLLFGLKVFSTCPYGDCRELTFPEFFFFANKRLVNHSIETLQVNDFDMCQMRCYQNPNCVSINFNFNQDSQANNNCELNNETHKSHENELDAKTGYAYHGTLNACDKAYCANEGTCQSGFTDKGYRCLCRLGFTSAHCEQDIDECSTGNHNCSHVAVCNNTIGSYNCTCKEGYVGDGRNCLDIDECLSAKDNCSQYVAVCNNTIGSYNCSCKEGYVGDGRNCSDIDECSTGEHNCSHEAVCNNTIGTYNCTCQEGYVGDGRNCSDIDECLTGDHNCSHVTVCNNTIGSYNCTCQEGYVGDHQNCSDKRRDCPEDWVANDNYCYKLHTSSRPSGIEQAKEKCQDLRARLPIIKSEPENTFIAGLMSKEKHRVWLGMKRENGKWRWFDGTSAEKNDTGYNAWAKDKPKNKRCAYISIHHSNVPGKWHDGHCHNLLFPPFLLCQKLR